MKEEKKEEKRKKCERCGTEVVGGLVPNLEVLIELQGKVKEANLKKLVEQLINTLKVENFVLCLRCQKTLSKLLSCPINRLFIPIDAAKFDAEAEIEVFQEILKEKEEKREEIKKAQQEDWLKRLVNQKVQSDEINFHLDVINENSVVCCSVPGCGVRAKPTDTNIKGKYLLANVNILILTKDGLGPVFKKRIVPLCLHHAHRAVAISNHRINYYPLIETLRKFKKPSTKLGDLPTFQKLKIIK